MADISKIILPSGSEYDIKDMTARGDASAAMGVAGGANSRANSAYSLANSAYNLANAAVPASSVITTAQIEQIWEDN